MGYMVSSRTFWHFLQRAFFCFILQTNTWKMLLLLLTVSMYTMVSTRVILAHTYLVANVGCTHFTHLLMSDALGSNGF